MLVVIGVNAQGFREALAVESAARSFAEQKPGEKKEAYRNLLKGLLERGLTGVQLVISDDHESIKGAVQIELPSVKFAGMQMQWQRCIKAKQSFCRVHFERNVLCHIRFFGITEKTDPLPTWQR